MYKNNQVFYPKKIYYNFDFNFIKEQFKNTLDNYKDYGSVFIVEDETFTVSINNIGKVEMFFNDDRPDILRNKVKYIESIFKEQINEFEISLN